MDNLNRDVCGAVLQQDNPQTSVVGVGANLQEIPIS